MGVIIEFVALLVATVFIGAISLLAHRARILFEVEFRAGHLWRARGRIPPKLLHDFMDVTPRKPDTRLFIRCLVERDRARLVARGNVTDDLTQQLRNLLGLWPLVRLRSAPKIRT